MLFVGLNKTLSIKYRLLIIQYNLILADFIFKDSISKKKGRASHSEVPDGHEIWETKFNSEQCPCKKKIYKGLKS